MIAKGVILFELSADAKSRHGKRYCHSSAQSCCTTTRPTLLTTLSSQPSCVHLKIPTCYGVLRTSTSATLPRRTLAVWKGLTLYSAIYGYQVYQRNRGEYATTTLATPKDWKLASTQPITTRRLLASISYWEHSPITAVLLCQLFCTSNMILRRTTRQTSTNSGYKLSGRLGVWRAAMDGYRGKGPTN